MTLGSTHHILLAGSADPATAALFLESFEQRHPESFARLAASAASLQTLIAVFANSRFLSEEVMQRPEWIEQIVDTQELFRSCTSEELAILLDSMLPEGTPSPVTLAQFRRRQILRILLRDVFGLATLAEVTSELSAVADAILDVTYRRIRALFIARHGVPQCDGSPCGFSILALGKLGGSELNYSSDIDLMFVYSGAGQTDGDTPLANSEFFRKVANSLTDLLSTYTPAGLCYRVDLRLRPDGRLGELCLTREAACHYYATRARDWELQMLIKARVAAGEPEPGREMLEAAESRIYASSLDFSAVEAVSMTRERIHEKLAAKRTGTRLDVKLARGGIRDIEFLVQCLQRLHGGREPWVRHAGTMLALIRLADKNLISPAEYARLANAYLFLRHLEHRLQFAEDRQTHELPSRREELDTLARRMPASELGRMPSADKLLHRLNACFEDVQELYDRVIHSQQPLYYSAAPPSRAEAQEHEPEAPTAWDPSATSNLIRFLDQRAPGIAEVVRQRPPRRSGVSFEAFLEHAFDNPDQLRELNESPELTNDVLELFECSPWFAEELVRRPELLVAVRQARETIRPAYGDMADLLGGATQLRLFFRREMLRIQAASICCRTTIFDTLGDTSDLADAVIQTAYTLAKRQVLAAHPPASPSYEPADQMMVIALGRLGMREFDLGSDADLNFVIPDIDAGETRFWTRVAERTVDIISAYTGEGVMFAVDTRLRPNGREGTLVQTVSACYDYLEQRAEAWEGITYMKSRCVVGNAARSTEFLHELQQVDWRRYGQSGRSRSDLRAMRRRLEREQGLTHPLKAGPGGYYDIDFALMYLRLRSAGIFFRVLNTPERIDIIEKMGHIDREGAVFLGEAATLYRAIDHALRLYSGHAEGRLPQAPGHLETLTQLVRRWAPSKEGLALPDELAHVQQRTRKHFRRLFGNE
ncbi:MAG: glutamine-synthetase adenylyltransferase [Bryobacteraceae bacterium]|nr:glutamine-synthetase adenylyltransferase [Bryobacteraceae bacterium]